MKRISLFIFLCLSSFSLFLFLSCSDSSEPTDNKRLIIENGFYQRINSSEPNSFQYKIEFRYYAKGEKCSVGGYSVIYDSESMTINIYSMQVLAPDFRYKATAVLEFKRELKTNPIIKMQGYKIESSEIFDELKAEYVLQPKN